MGATVVYGDNIIHTAQDGETFTLNTEDSYLDSDIVVAIDETLPSAEGISF